MLMPSHSRRYAGVKIATVAPGNPRARPPRIQGHCLLMDAGTLSPPAVLDGVELTAVRTAAVSAAAGLLAEPDAGRLVVFDTDCSTSPASPRSGPYTGQHPKVCSTEHYSCWSEGRGPCTTSRRKTCWQLPPSLVAESAVPIRSLP
ncbi:hypothetical protein AB0P36_24020 [Streptomyces flavidovirens]|uniref:hypothetical protein n=1 Tax=Streptomyces flavidovirens TaxID=67298 RepID=UPI00342439AB